jgi:5-methylcytosine-specific restriction endonuclease McrA
MQRVFVLDTNKKPLNMCRPSRARKLLNAQKAAVFKMFPFTIILKKVVNKNPNPVRIKIDPGSKFTGFSIINQNISKDGKYEVIFAAELTHRGQVIKNNLEQRKNIRRSRRNRKTRYRKARFNNRIRTIDWLPPSLMHRVFGIETWIKRFYKSCNIQAISIESVKFDMQKIRNPNIIGKEYQQGELLGYETREYLLEKWGRKCAYCGKTNIPLEIEHIIPKSKGGTNAVFNLTISCHNCNQAKNNLDIKDFLKNKLNILQKINKFRLVSLKDAAAVNSTRNILIKKLKQSNLDIELGSGGLTKFNRIKRKFSKTHWLDATCVGLSTPQKININNITPLIIIATGHGNRQMCRVDKYGFPRTKAKSSKIVQNFQTGDIVKAIVTKGKKIGTYIGRVAIRKSGSFNIKLKNIVIQGISYKYCQKIYMADGYSYF